MSCPECNRIFMDAEDYRDHLPCDGTLSFVGLEHSLTFLDYQKLVSGTAIYPDRGHNWTYPLMGLCGESGECAEKGKKIIRDNGGVFNKSDKESMAKELGDVLWYVTALAEEIGYTLDDIAKMNIAKLLSRKSRGVLGGSGDNR